MSASSMLPPAAPAARSAGARICSRGLDAVGLRAVVRGQRRHRGLVQILARVKKTPAQQYLIVGLIPLVPGATLYYAMSAVVQQDWHRRSSTATGSRPSCSASRPASV